MQLERLKDCKTAEKALGETNKCGKACYGDAESQNNGNVTSSENNQQLIELILEEAHIMCVGFFALCEYNRKRIQLNFWKRNLLARVVNKFSTKDRYI